VNVSKDFRLPHGRERAGANRPAAIALVAIKHGADSRSVGEKLDKSFDLRYPTGNSQICKNL